MTDSIVDNMIIGTDISVEVIFVVQRRLIQDLDYQ